MKIERPIACVDLETTGVDIYCDRIVEIAVVRLEPEGDRKPIGLRINPGCPIPPAASSVHGITDADVADMPKFAEVAGDILGFLEGCDITGYNVRRFDVPILIQEFLRAGIAWGANLNIIDVFDIYRSREPQTLARALTFYTGRDLGNDAHSAVVDADAALDVLLGQATRYGCEDIAALSKLQRDPDWVDEQGKLKWVGTTAVLTFGKWAGRPLQQVDPTYLRWMLGQEFPPEVKHILANAARGVFPQRIRTAGVA